MSSESHATSMAVIRGQVGSRHCCQCRAGDGGTCSHVGGLQLCDRHRIVSATGDEPIGGYVALLEEQRRHLEDRLVKISAVAGALHQALVHSTDQCATVTELRCLDKDLLDALGVTGG